MAVLRGLYRSMRQGTKLCMLSAGEMKARRGSQLAEPHVQTHHDHEADDAAPRRQLAVPTEHKHLC